MNNSQERKSLYFQHMDDYFRYCFIAREKDFITTSQYTRWCSHLPIFNYNGLFLKETIAGNVLDEHLDFFQNKNLPHWWIASEKNEITTHLESKGYCCHGYLAFISLEASAHPVSLPSNNRVTIRRVNNDLDMKIFAEILSEVFFAPYKKESAAFIFEGYRTLGYDLECPFSHYLGYLDGKPVGTSSLLFTKDHHEKPVLAGFWNDGVLETARRNGVGTVMALRRIQDATQRNVSHFTSVLMPDGMAWSYYRPLGFKESFKAYPYLSTQ